MTGGQVIIPIRGVNGEKISLDTLTKSLKSGTFAKIKRAINLQKEIVLNDVIVAGYKVTVASGLAYLRDVSDIETVRFAASGLTSAGVNETISIIINANDTGIINAN